jgi:dipeptide transport system ATP-binding protein
MSGDLLVARDIHVAFGGGRRLFGAPSPRVDALKGVSIRIARRETVGVVGESGSGKTTLGRALLRLVDVTAGRVEFDGQDITRLPEVALRPLRRRMQPIFQDPLACLNPRQTILTIVTEPMLFHRVAAGRAEAEAKARAIFDRFSLPASCLGRYPHELSGGQRQRVGIARAALLQPDFLLADEIVSGLDVSTQAQALNLIAGLTRDLGLAMVFISHDLSVIRAICDRVYVLRLGEIVEEGPCETVFSAPKHDYTRALIDAIPLPTVSPDWLRRTAAAEVAA